MARPSETGSCPAGQAPTGLGASGFDPARCRNCAGDGWVCENHQDAPWDAAVEHGCECGAGAPCPVCNRDMACASYSPHWRPIETAPKDGTAVLVCGGTREHPDSMGGPRPFQGISMARWNQFWSQWDGESVSHDDCYCHEPTRWMPLPAIAIEAATAGETHSGSTEGESAGPKDIAQ